MGLGADPATEIFAWLRVAGLAGLLGFALWRARRRWLASAPGDQARRLVYPCLAVLLGSSIYLGLLTIFLAPWLIFYVVAVAAFWVMVPTVASVAAVDLGAKLLRAERTAPWFAGGIVAYVAIAFLWLGLTGRSAMRLIPGLWLETLLLASIPTSAAILWWAYLPGSGGGSGGIEEAFE